MGLLLGAMLLSCQASADPDTSAPMPTSSPTAAPTQTPVPTPIVTAAATPLPTATRSDLASTPTMPSPTPTAQPAPTPTPTGPSLSEVPPTDGPVRVSIMPTRHHFPYPSQIGDVPTGSYNTIPPTSGPHWDAWSDCGFYNYPLPDELLVHNLEHGNIIVSYNLTGDTEIKALRQAVDSIPLAAEYAIVRRYLDIPEGMVALTTWGVLDRMVGVDAERIAAFFAAYPGNTGPEFPNGLPCTTGVQMTESSSG
ncbi:MAG: DUF3105 domain-containing protein [Chloroflexi bacterium]|nr:DUF3105 domain-containing protein [Chloroflexota bacterium]MYD47052.1 DUF3105 domain-containing protein [Chloroflexota bacterium]